MIGAGFDIYGAIVTQSTEVMWTDIGLAALVLGVWVALMRRVR